MSEPRPPRRRLTGTLADPEVEGIYEAILRSQRPTVEGLIAAGWSRASVAKAMDLLHWRELIDADGDHIEVHAPDVALRTYAATLERQARGIRANIELAQRAYATARAQVESPSSERVRRLHGWEEITAVALSLEQRLVASLDVVVAGGPRLELIVSGVHEPITERRGSVITRRAIITSAVLGDEAVDSDFSDREEIGYDIRTALNLPYNLLIADRTTALIDTTNKDPEGRGSLVVHDRVLVEWLCSWFDLVYRAATPLAVNTDASGLCERDTRIFTLMAAGLTDASIARRLGISPRTVERRTSVLMERVEATTRFQAGVKAVRAGLI